ncbi:MAG: OmpA family protein [Bacteroidota bacterium]
MRTSFTHILFFVLLFAGLGELYAQSSDTTGVAPLNELIPNTAFGTYISSGGETVEIQSNTVEISVLPYEAAILFPSQFKREIRGNRVSYTHFYRNIGNIPFTVDIEIVNLDQDDYDLEEVTIDFRSDGVQNKSALTAVKGAANTGGLVAELTTTLQPNETFEFAYSGRINEEIRGAIESVVLVQGTSRESGFLVQNFDTTRTFNGTVIDLEKEAVKLNEDLEQGDTFDYVVRGVNSSELGSDLTALGRDILLDGNVLSKVVLRDSIPANLTFQAFKNVPKGQNVYHVFGAEEFEFTTVQPQDLSQVDVIAILYDSITVDEQFEFSFEVEVNENAAGQIINIAEVSFTDQDGTRQSSTASNQVIDLLPERDAEINYFTDQNFVTRTNTSSVGSDLHVEADAGRCNISAGIVDRVAITIRSVLTGDQEEFEGVETGPNTGMFRIPNPVPTRDFREFTVTPGNEIIEAAEEDELVAVLTCPAVRIEDEVTTSLRVDPFGIVFDSDTDAPVAGAEVRIIDLTGQGNGGNAGGLAQVFDVDGTTPFENPQITGEDGRFSFPFLNPSTYRVEVGTPQLYVFPSQVNRQFLPETRNIDTLASYGQTFSIENNAAGLDFDIPLDGQSRNVLFTEKTVDQSTVEIGEFVNYTVTIRSIAVNTVRELIIRDELPFGFEYQPGSARLDGTFIPDPEGGRGPLLTFQVDSILTGQTRTLNYRVYVGPGAENGDGINTAIAQGDTSFIAKSSNQAQVQIEVSGGVFSQEGFIFGKVFMDCDENDIQSYDELGVPGVRLYLEDGTFVETDAEGKYSIYGIRPNKHVLKVDNTTLPKGALLAELDNRHAGDPSSRFVDLKKGEMHRADFAICNCDARMFESVYARIEALAGVDPLAASVTENFQFDDRRNGNGLQAGQASGIVGANRSLGDDEGVQTPAERADSVSIAADSAMTGEPLLEDAILFADATLSIMNLADGDTLNTGFANIWVKSRTGAMIDLFVNDEVVGASQIGKKAVSQEGVQGLEYIAVELTPGVNLISAVEADPFGNVRGEETIQVFVPGDLFKIDIQIYENHIPANGLDAAKVRIRLLDANHIKIGAPTQLTLDVDYGQWNVNDLNPNEPGTQILVENGELFAELRSMTDPKTTRVRANVGVIETEEVVHFVPDLRPLIAAGIIEGTIRLNQSVNVSSALEDDGFERELQQLSTDFGSFTGDSRIAFFLKGKVRGNALLTAGYDSERSQDDRLFRDIQPDEFYPVYGDNSLRGFDAQSTGRLYVRVDKNKTYALYGDFITQERDEARQLGDYSRAQTGFKANVEKNGFSVEGFASSAYSTRRIREFRAQGLSRYEILNDNGDLEQGIVNQSEIIELVTYDREQPDVILDVQRLTRFVDYALEVFTSTIIFTQPIFSVDESFNPVFIRVTYEADNNDERYLIAGATAKYEVQNKGSVSASVVQDDNPENEFMLSSVNGKLNVGKNTRVIAEVAQTTTDLEGTGAAGRIEIQHKGKKLTALGQVGRSADNFANQAGTLGQGRTEARARASYKLGSKTKVSSEFLISQSDTSSQQTIGGLFDLRQTITSNINAGVGLRYSQQQDPNQAEDITNTNLRANITSKVPLLNGASVFGEYEQDLEETDRRLVAAGMDYRFFGNSKLYARHEFISSAAGRFTLRDNAQRNNTVVGLKSNFMKNGEVFSEYRVQDAFDGPTGQAAIGLRNNFQIRPGLTANAGFERQFTVRGVAGQDATAISGALAYTANPNWKGTTRSEARFSGTSNVYLNTVGYGLRISEEWTFLGKNIVSVSTPTGTGPGSIFTDALRIQERFRIGAAFRDTYRNRFDALLRYEWRYEKENSNANFREYAHIFSSHANYHPTADLVVSGRVAAKASVAQDDILRSTSFLEMVSGRAIYDLNDKWDAGINASLLANSDFTTRDYGLGVELGFIMARNLRVAAGFNFFGYEDEDLAPNNYTRAGAYLGFAYKFDEQLFDNLLPTRVKGAKHIIDPSLYLTCELACEEPPEILNIDLPEFTLTLQPAKLAARDLEYEELETLILLPQHIHFDNDRTYINAAAAQMLDKVAKFLIDRDDYFINVLGHTDTKASQAYNLDLSERRARAVRAYLVAAGVDGEKLQFEGLSFSKGEREENDRVDMAKNRRVELDLNTPNMNVRFIKQVQDLQVNQKIRNIGPWDYIYNAEHNAVPGNMTFTSNNTLLDPVNVYLLERIAMAMVQFFNVQVTVALPDNEFAQARAQVITDALQFGGITGERVNVQLRDDLRPHQVLFAYTNVEQLNVVEQNDDIKFENNSLATSMMNNLLDILKTREDYLLLLDMSQTYVVPDRINFSGNSSALSNETQAVLSRVGSYMRSNRPVRIELKGAGNAIDGARMQAIRDYLIAWGIPEYNVTITSGQADLNGQVIHIKYLNADSIRLLESKADIPVPKAPK